MEVVLTEMLQWGTALAAPGKGPAPIVSGESCRYCLRVVKGNGNLLRHEKACSARHAANGPSGKGRKSRRRA